MRTLKGFLVIILALYAGEVYAGVDTLSKKNYEESKMEKGVIIYGVNWGAKWGCAGLDNAQLQNLTFSHIDSISKSIDGEEIVLNTPAKLLSKDTSKSVAMIINPGKYALTGFDIKVAQSSRRVAHIKKDVEDLFENGKSASGTFEVNAGEIVYIGDFGLDCTGQPIPWRYYIQKEDFDRYIAQFKKRYKFLSDKPVIYRLFETNKFGR